MRKCPVIGAEDEAGAGWAHHRAAQGLEESVCGAEAGSGNQFRCRGVTDHGIG